MSLVIEKFPSRSSSTFAKKPVLVKAIKMPKEFAVKTPAGVSHGRAGDYIVLNQKNEMLPMGAEDFERLYEKMTIGFTNSRASR